MKKTLFLLSLLLTLSACMVGPDYKAPSAQGIPQKWANAPDNEISSRNIEEEVEWWKLFGDPMLTCLVQEAIQSNYDLKTAFAKICQARAVLLGQTADLMPEIDGIGSYSRNENSLNSSLFSNAQNTTAATPAASGAGTAALRYFNLNRLGFDTAWEIDLFGRIRRGIESAEASLEAQVDDMHNTLLSLISEVAITYINLRSYQKQFAVQTKSLAAWDSIYRLNQSLKDAGLATDIDVAQAKTARDQTEAALYPLDESIKSSIHQLSILEGKPPEALYEFLSESRPIPSPPPEIFTGIPSELLRRRPDIMEAERNIAAANAQIGVAMGSLFPIFSFTGIVGYQSNWASNLASPQSGFYSFGPGFTWDIIDFGRVRSMIDSATAVKNQNYYQYKSTVLNALADVENALVRCADESKRHISLKNAFDASKTAYEVSLLRYESGLIPYIVALQTENSYQQNALDLVQSEASIALNAVALYKALGGGWQIDKTNWTASKTLCPL